MHFSLKKPGINDCVGSGGRVNLHQGLVCARNGRLALRDLFNHRNRPPNLVPGHLEIATRSLSAPSSGQVFYKAVRALKHR